MVQIGILGKKSGFSKTKLFLLKKDMEDNWKPLESNPDVFNRVSKDFGFDSSSLMFQDLFGMEDWAYDMVGKPVKGVIFCFQMKKHHKKANLPDPTPDSELPDGLFFMTQISSNACGTVAIFHCVGNLDEDSKANFVKPDSVMHDF